MLRLRNLTCLTRSRFFSTSENNILEHLDHKTVLRVSGPEVAQFLQSLITNDIAHLGMGHGSMYTMFLNNRGRILYDVILYRHHTQDSYLLECDKEGADALQKHLKIYRVRRKIDITNLRDELKIYVLYNNSNVQEQVRSEKSVADVTTPYQKLIDCYQNNKSQELLVYRDPRLSLLGSRIIAKEGLNVLKRVNEIVTSQVIANNMYNYRWLRYSLGVGEGLQDLPPEESFPLECNCDYLHGISFHKGCYVGQELTARVYHTGVIRKRLMPIHFTKIPSKTPEEKIVQANENLGKFRGIECDAGLGLFRIAKALACKEVAFGDGVGVVTKPNWWPSEAPKEKAQIISM